MYDADKILNLITLFGVFSAFAIFWRTKKSSLDNKLSALYAVLAIFFLSRNIFYWFNYPISVGFIMGSGALLPIMTLLVAEEILRRHAYNLLKIFTLSGAVCFAICAIFLGPNWPIFWLSIFAIYCTLSLIFITMFLLKNRNNQNAPYEKKMIDSFIISIAICASLIVTEFKELLPYIPISFGAIGVLIFVNTTLSLSMENASPRRIIIDLLALIIASSILLFVILNLISNINFTQSIQIFTCALAINTISLGLYRIINHKMNYINGKDFIEEIGKFDDIDVDQIIMAHPIASSGKIITEKELQLYGQDISANFLKHRVISRQTFTDNKTADALANLLDEYGTNYLLRLSKNPIKFITIATGTIGFNKKLEAELRILTLISERSIHAKIS